MNKQGKEIERKFLVKRLPNISPCKKTGRCEQGYLSVNPNYEVRISNRLDPHLTSKFGVGLSREETIEKVSNITLEILWPLTEGKRVIKDRSFYQLENNLIAEVDYYLAHNLMTVDVEFLSEEAAKKFVPPDWFGEEITNIKGYRNSALAC